MKLKIKEVKETEIPCVDDLTPGQLFLDTHGCVNLVVNNPYDRENAFIYWDSGNPHLASAAVIAETEVDRLLTLKDLEFTN